MDVNIDMSMKSQPMNHDDSKGVDKDTTRTTSDMWLLAMHIAIGV